MSDYDDDERPSFGGGVLDLGSSLGRRKADDSDEETPSKKPKLGGFAGLRNGKSSSGGGAGAAGKQTFAQKMMAKMGWEKGQGLGADGRGRLAPVETQLRPQGAGVGAVKEKTKQAKEEEKRAAAFRGEVLEDSSEEERKKKKERKAARKAAAATGGASTPGSAARRKPKYATVEQIKADLQGLDIPPNVLQSALDLTGKGVDSFASPGGFVAARDDSEATKASRRMQLELEACATSRHGLNERKAYLDDTTSHLVDGLDREKEELRRVQDLLGVVSRLQELSISPNSGLGNDAWSGVIPRLAVLETDFTDSEIDKYNISDIAIATIHPLFRAEMLEWSLPDINQPLLDSLSRLSHLLGIHGNSSKNALVQKRQDPYRPIRRNRKATTPYESMIHTHFLPQIRSYINGTWDSHDPSALPDLIKAWRPLLPEFIYNNIISQLLVPRLTDALSSWKPPRSSKSRRSSPNPDTWLFPWLPLLPASELDPSSSTGLLVEVKRRLRSLLSTHPPESGPPSYLTPWRSLLRDHFPTLLTTRLVPRLSSYFSTSFTIDPADQPLQVFQTFLDYSTLLPPSTMAQILVANFFPIFRATLYDWLTGEPQYAEIRQWYEWWKEIIPQSIRSVEALWGEWTKVFEMMANGADLGPERSRKKLRAPEGQQQSAPLPGTSGSATPKKPVKVDVDIPKTTLEPPEEATFRDVLEEWCAENDLLLVAMREAHEATGAHLFRVTASADQRGGVVIYLRGDVLFARAKKDKSLWEPMGLGDELLERAGGR